MPQPENGSSTEGRIFKLDPDRVKPFASQPRKRFRGIKQLAESIRLVGQVTPIVVTTCEDPGYDAELVDGERRLRACLEGGMRVRAVFEATADTERYVRSIAANFCRQGHDAVEIMEAVAALKDSGRSNEEIAGIFGKTISWVSQYMSLKRLAPAVLEQLKVAGDEAAETKSKKRARGRATFSVALLLVSLPPSQQVYMLRRIKKGKMSMEQARTAVARFAAGRGIKTGSKQTNPERFRAIRSAVEKCSHVVERYLTMPGAQIASVVSGAKPVERRELSDRLEKLCEDLLVFSDALGK